MPDEPYSIPLRARDGTLRAYALIDAADAGLPLHGSTVGELRWCLSSKGYAARALARIDGRPQGQVTLHRVILGLSPGDGLDCDHINRDRVDCRRANLRIATNAENSQNLGLHAANTSGVRGVSWHAQRGKWQASARLNGRKRFLGYFATLADAEAVVVAWRQEHMPFSAADHGTDHKL